MKKSILIVAGAVVLTLGFTSCKKNWTCSCSNGGSTVISNQTKSSATSSCNAIAATYATTCNI